MSDSVDLLIPQEECEYDQWMFEYCKQIIDAFILISKTSLLIEKDLPDVSLKVRYSAIKALDDVKLEMYRIIKSDYRSENSLLLGSNIQYRIGIAGGYEYSLDVSVVELDRQQPWKVAPFLISQLKSP